MLSVKATTLCRCADRLGVPVLASVLANPKQTEKLLLDGIAADDGVHISARTVLNPWDDGDLVAQVDSGGRRRLILLGGWCDSTVVMAALSALADGFDTHVVADCCPGLMDDPGAVALHRLVQAGVVPVTWRQVVFEWMRHRPECLNASSLRDILGDDARLAPWIDVLCSTHA
jgi:nicotinamidase-related amidase